MPRDIWSRYKGPEYDLTFQREFFQTKEDVRREYNRLRLLANTRAKALARNKEFGTTALKKRYSEFKPLPKKTTEGRMRKALADVARQLGTKAATVSGQREQRRKSIEALRGHGYKFVTTKNYKEFARFMEAARDHFGKRGFDSERVATMYENAKKSKLSIKKVQKAFETYLDKGLDKGPIMKA